MPHAASGHCVYMCTYEESESLQEKHIWKNSPKVAYSDDTVWTKGGLTVLYISSNMLSGLYLTLLYSSFVEHTKWTITSDRYITIEGELFGMD